MQQWQKEPYVDDHVIATRAAQWGYEQCEAKYVSAACELVNPFDFPELLGDDCMTDAEKLDWLRRRARQNTAHDLYGNGGHWSIGFHSDDNRLSFDEAIEAAAKEEQTDG